MAYIFAVVVITPEVGGGGAQNKRSLLQVIHEYILYHYEDLLEL